MRQKCLRWKCRLCMATDGFCMVENSVTVFFPASHLLAVLVTPQMAATNSTPGHISNNYLWFEDICRAFEIKWCVHKVGPGMPKSRISGLDGSWVKHCHSKQMSWHKSEKYEKMPKLHKPCEWPSKTFENNDCLLYTKIQWTCWSGVGKTWENKVWTQSVGECLGLFVCGGQNLFLK
jgi:hypothetical protein